MNNQIRPLIEKAGYANICFSSTCQKTIPWERAPVLRFTIQSL